MHLQYSYREVEQSGCQGIKSYQRERATRGHSELVKVRAYFRYNYLNFNLQLLPLDQVVYVPHVASWTSLPIRRVPS